MGIITRADPNASAHQHWSAALQVEDPVQVPGAIAMAVDHYKLAVSSSHFAWLRTEWRCNRDRKRSRSARSVVDLPGEAPMVVGLAFDLAPVGSVAAALSEFFALRSGASGSNIQAWRDAQRIAAYVEGQRMARGACSFSPRTPDGIWRLQFAPAEDLAERSSHGAAVKRNAGVAGDQWRANGAQRGSQTPVVRRLTTALLAAFHLAFTCWLLLSAAFRCVCYPALSARQQVVSRSSRTIPGFTSAKLRC